MTQKKNQARALGFAAVAATAGVFSLVVLNGWIQGYEAEIARHSLPEDTVMVMVAARDLYQGITIEENDLYAVQIPPRYLPENVFLAPDYVIGRTPRERILANEFVRSDRLADPESGIGMNAVIPRGMRAISVNLSDGRALAGFLEPGNYVDVLVTMAPEGNNSEELTKTVLQAVFVLGVNNRMGSEDEATANTRRKRTSPTVTLLVTSDEAEDIAFAEAMGQITLSLRSMVDLDLSAEVGEGVTLGELLGRVKAKKEPARVRPVKDPACASVKFIKGRNDQTYKVDCEGRIMD